MRQDTSLCLKNRRMDKSREILIVGTLPSVAGVGGVTVHVSRLCEALRDKGVPMALCDYKTLSLPRQIRMIKDSSIVHLHVSNPFLRMFYVVLCRLFSRKSVLTFHGNLGRFGALKNAADLAALRLCDVPVMINEGSWRKSLTYNPRAVLIPAYIPAGKSEHLPEDIVRIVSSARDSGRKIMATNASYMHYSDSGEEIYGILFLVEYVRNHDGYMLVVSDPSGQYSARFEGKMPENVCFITQKHSFSSLLSYADLMIRATSTDGDSLSVREALDSGIRVLATDCVDRPEGVVLFKYGDAVSLTDALEAEYDSKEERRQCPDTVGMLVNIYESMRNG